MTQEELALRAGVTKRTIERVERSLPALACTLRCIADVFSVHATELYEHSEEFKVSAPFEMSKSSSAYPEPGDFQLVIVIGKDPENLTSVELAALGNDIVSGLRNHTEIVVRWVKRGSVLITIELTAADAERLAALIEDERFLKHGVVGVKRVALGRAREVACVKTLSWLEKKLAERLGISDCDIDPRDTFGMLHLNQDEATKFIMQFCEDYEISNGIQRFESFILGKYKLDNLFAWSYVPIGDLCDFVHENDERECSQ